MDTDAIEHCQPAPPKGLKRFFQFSLRSLFWAITFWSVLVVVFTRLGTGGRVEFAAVGVCVAVATRKATAVNRYVPRHETG